MTNKRHFATLAAFISSICRPARTTALGLATGLVVLSAWIPSAGAQDFPNHSFPRIGLFHWSGSVNDWYARHDLLMHTLPRHRDQGAEWARGLKAKNPNIILLPTLDWNAGPQEYEQLPDEWFLRDSKGNKLPLYGDNTGIFLMNISEYCPPVNGKKYYEYVTEWHISRIDLSVFDGIATDGLWDYPWGPSDIDYNRNGVNDFDEHGRDWVRQTQTRGANLALQHARKLVGDNKAILVNSGGFHSFGREFSNGIVAEHFSGVSDLNYIMNQYRAWETQGQKPHVTLIQGNMRPLAQGQLGKNNFRDMRFGLGVTLMYNGYFCAQPYEGGEHYFTSWYDEFDLNLGFPKGDPIEIRKNVFVRFFDHGAAILNGAGRNETVSEADLQSRQGYDGPYYFFRGGQNPAVNNGRRFDSVTLESRKESETFFKGDAIVLLREPKIVVADIIIDDSESGTTPSVQAIETTGAWARLFENDRHGAMYTVRTASWHSLAKMSAAYTTDPGDGGNRATFKLNFGVPGTYEVFEWHGYLGGSPEQIREGTNVPHIIRHADGETTVAVDQSRNYGQWNSLGTYVFSTAKNQAIVITNKADGPVIADAIKLVLRQGGDDSSDITPPVPPAGVRVQGSN